MKHYFKGILTLILILPLFCFADTSIPKSKRAMYKLEQSLEKRKKKLDSSLKHTDAMMDSLAGTIKYTHLDTMQVLYLMETKKEREEDERRWYWTKVAVFSLLAILGIGFYGKQRGWWIKEKREGRGG